MEEPIVRLANRRMTVRAFAHRLAWVGLALSFAPGVQALAATIGSPNTVTADPPVPRPHTKPCVVPLFSKLEFADFSIKTYQYTPPAGCPGPWQKIVFAADFGVTAGRQFDRTAIVDLAYVNIYFGTTAEPSRTVARTWHVERDETNYAALFMSPGAGHVILGNVVDATYTGVIDGSAQLEFYPMSGFDDDGAATSAADAVLPVTQPNSAGGVNEPAFLNTPADTLATTFTLPTNIERAYLDVITQSQSNDEFWYTCVPNDVAAELQSCGSTAFRETDVSIDGTVVGVAPVTPWIYTGGLDPYLWRPIPGAQTLNFPPYRVDLTPYAALLSDGRMHTVALSVINADAHFAATATLLLYLDGGSARVTGGVTTNTLGTGPVQPATLVTEDLVTDASGNITGSVTTTSSHDFVVAGYIVTSKGRRDTEVHQRSGFSNTQNFVIDATTYSQIVAQSTDVELTTSVRHGGDSAATTDSFHYPLTLGYIYRVNPDGTSSQQSSVTQDFKAERRSTTGVNSVSNRVTAADTLNFDAGGNLSSNSGASSSQTYSSTGLGGTYFCQLMSAGNVLASIKGCAGEE